jgi:Family of unknown function (DUF5723)
MKKAIILSLVFLAGRTFGQDTYTMKFVPQLEQSQWCDASNLPENKVSIGLPVISGVSFYVYNSGFTFHDVFKNMGDTAQSVNMGQVFNHLKASNYVSFGGSADIFSLNIARNKVSVGFSMSDKANFNFTYPADFFKFFWYGNGPTLGQAVQIGNFGVDASWYREYAFHFAYNYKKWTFGINPKLLVGKTNIHTESTSLTLRTDPDNFYRMTAVANVNVKMSGIEDSADKADGGYFSNASKSMDYVLNTANIGHAIDLSARYAISKKISVAAGINNLGSIHWASNVHNYTANNQTFSFDGLPINNFFQGDSNAVTAQTLKDSINRFVKFKEDANAYTTVLPYDMFAMGNFQVKHHMLGIELTARKFNNDFLYAGTLAYQIKLGKHFIGTVTYTLKSYSTFNLGGAAIFQFLNMQFYVVTDNWYAAVIPLDSKNANLNAGMNLVFGNRLRKDNYAKDRAEYDDFQPVQ